MLVLEIREYFVTTFGLSGYSQSISCTAWELAMATKYSSSKSSEYTASFRNLLQEYMALNCGSKKELKVNR